MWTVILLMLFGTCMCLAEHNYLSNTIRKKARSIRSKLARGPSYTPADKPGGRNALIVRTGSFSDTSASDNLTKKSVSYVLVLIMVSSAKACVFLFFFLKENFIPP